MQPSLRAYRAGVRVWCDQHALPCLPADAADVVAFLAAERGRGLTVNTIDLRRAAIRYLHFIAGLPVPSAEAQVAPTMAGIHRAATDAGVLPAKKLAATADILREILAGIPDDLAGRRDRARTKSRSGAARFGESNAPAGSDSQACPHHALALDGLTPAGGAAQLPGRE